MAKKVQIIYKAVPTAKRFHADNSLVRGVMGPVRSGKSVMMANELFRRAAEQEPFNGKRKTKWVVIRNTYRQLEDTTLATWLQWFPEDYFGKFNKNSMTHSVKFNDVECEILFRALDVPKDIRNLLSLEVTGGWINEAREIPWAIASALIDRSGQYPAKKDGGCTWRGVIMDTNPPDNNHWWYQKFEEDLPSNWKIFRQPGALIERDSKYIENVDAENIENLNEGIDYYLSRVEGKNKDEIKVYYCAEYGFVSEGKPVHPDYVDSVHCTNEVLRPIPRLKLIIGLDFGLTPAAIFAQKYPNGRWVWIDELTTMNSATMGAKQFGEALLRKMVSEYRGMKYEAWGDPAGDERSQTDETTVYQILKSVGIEAKPVWTNDTAIRRESVGAPLRRLVDGKPGLMISPKCKITRAGLAGGFCYKRLQVSGTERFHLTPDKNMYSHPVEAGEYGMIGGGEGHNVVYSDYEAKNPQPKVEYDEFNY